MAGPMVWPAGENGGTDLRLLLAFADQEPYAYIRGFILAARALLHSGEVTSERKHLHSVIVFVYKHSVSLRLKLLTISAAKLLQKSLTLSHVRAINGLSIGQLWPNLIVMLDEIEAAIPGPKAPEWHDIEQRLQLLGNYDPDLCALWSLAAHRSEACKRFNGEGEEAPPPSSDGELIKMLEGLSDNLVGIEYWLNGHLAGTTTK